MGRQALTDRYAQSSAWLKIPHLIEIKYKDGCVCENCSKALSFIPSPCPRPSMRFYSLHVHLRDVEAGLKTPDSEKPNSDKVRQVPGPGVTKLKCQLAFENKHTFSGDRSFKVGITHATREDWRTAASPFRELICALGVHLQLFMILVVSWSWNLHRASHHDDIYTIAASKVS